jgi:hypothetical protein
MQITVRRSRLFRERHISIHSDPAYLAFGARQTLVGRGAASNRSVSAELHY